MEQFIKVMSCTVQKLGMVSVDILKKLLSVWMKMLNTLQYFCQLNVNGVNENNILYF